MGDCDGPTEMWVDADSPSNPYWNASCTIIYTYYLDVEPIFDSNCFGCHNSAVSLGGLNLSTYENIINSGSIVSGDALNSNLIDRITRFEGDGLLMPPTNRLSQDDIDIIIEWINNGAFE